MLPPSAAHAVAFVADACVVGRSYVRNDAIVPCMPQRARKCPVDSARHPRGEVFFRHLEKILIDRQGSIS